METLGIILRSPGRIYFSDGTVQDSAGGGGSSVWGGISGILSDQTDLQDELDDKQDQIDALVTEVADKQDTSEKGNANGYASLDGSAKIPINQIPDAVLGALKFKGTWNANTNVITSADLTLNGNPVPAASSSNNGYYLIVSIAGTTNIDGISTWAIGDWLLSYGTSWTKIDNTDSVSSVNGHTGTVVLDTADISDTLNKRYVTDANLTLIGNTSGTNTGNETASSIGSLINGVASKTTPINTDQLGLMDSAAGNVLKKLSWSNLKAALSTADIVDSTNKRYVTDADLTLLGNTSGTNTGNETANSIGALINAATSKTTPVDADQLGLMDSAAGNVIKKLSWANIKATLLSYFNSIISPRILYVDQDTGDDTYPGTYLRPYKTIQAAITAAELTAAYYKQVVVKINPPTGPNGYNENLTMSQQGVVLQGAPITNRSEIFVKGKLTINLTGTSGGANFAATQNAVYIKGLTLFNNGANTIEFSGTTFQRLFISDCYIDNTFSTGKALYMTNTGTSGATKSTIQSRDTDWNNSSTSVATIQISAGRLICYGSNTDIQNGQANQIAVLLDGASATGGSFTVSVTNITGQVKITDNLATATLSFYLITSGTLSGIDTPSSPNTGFITIGTGAISSTNTNCITGSGVLVNGGNNYLTSSSGGVVSTVTQVSFAEIDPKLLGATATQGSNQLLTIKDGHVRFQRTTAPTTGSLGNAGSGASATLTQATDNSGTLQLITGTLSYSAGAQVTVTFNKAFTTAPKVYLFPANASAATSAVARGVYVTSTTTTFLVNFAVADITTTTYQWNYLIIEST